jgi:hypothetical protein
LVRKGNVLEDIFPPVLAYWVSPGNSYPAAEVSAFPWVELARAIDDLEIKHATAPAASLRDPYVKQIPDADEERNSVAVAYEIRRNSDDPLEYIISKRTADSFDYKEIGRYQVLEVTEDLSVTTARLENIVYLLAGLVHRAHDFTGTGKRALYEILKMGSSDELSDVCFSTTNGLYVTQNATLSLSSDEIVSYAGFRSD